MSIAFKKLVFNFFLDHTILGEILGEKQSVLLRSSDYTLCLSSSLLIKVCSDILSMCPYPYISLTVPDSSH